MILKLMQKFFLVFYFSYIIPSITKIHSVIFAFYTFFLLKLYYQTFSFQIRYVSLVHATYFLTCLESCTKADVVPTVDKSGTYFASVEISNPNILSPCLRRRAVRRLSEILCKLENTFYDII